MSAFEGREHLVCLPGWCGRCDHECVPVNTVSWPEVAARLAAARSYWLSTTMPSGAPHVAPVWGVVISDVLYLYSERRTRKARNLAADPRLVVHLESADDQSADPMDRFRAFICHFISYSATRPYLAGLATAEGAARTSRLDYLADRGELPPSA